MNFNYNPANLYSNGFLGDALPDGRGDFGLPGGETGVGYYDSGPVDQFGLPDLGTLARLRDERDDTKSEYYSRGKEYGYPYSAVSAGDGYDSGPMPFLQGLIKEETIAEYTPSGIIGRNADPFSLVAPLLESGSFPELGKPIKNSRLDYGYTSSHRGPQRAETTYSKQVGPNRLKGANLNPGPMLTAAGLPEGFDPGDSQGGPRGDSRGGEPRGGSQGGPRGDSRGDSGGKRGGEPRGQRHSGGSRGGPRGDSRSGERREGFAVTGSRGTAPYPQARSHAFDVNDLLNNPNKPVEYYKGTTPSHRNPRSKDYIFSNKNGHLAVPQGVSMTAGTTITVDSDYLIGNNRNTPGGSQWAGAPSAFSAGAVGLGVESVGNQYGGSMLHREDNTFNGFTKDKTTQGLYSKNSVQGVYMGPPEPDVDGVNIGGPPPPAGLRVPDIFKNPNKSMDDYFTNIAYIKDNPQIIEFYGANMFELMEDGTYGNYRPSTVTATSKKNIVGEHYDDRLVDLRFGAEGTYQYALANGPGSTSRGVYLDMKTVKAMRPILDYIFYLKTSGAILPDQTDDFYFVTEEQYFSTGPLNKDIVNYCCKRYNTGMIDVFKFLNYVFQFFFKEDSMTVSDFRSYSKMINQFVSKHYSK